MPLYVESPERALQYTRYVKAVLVQAQEELDGSVTRKTIALRFVRLIEFCCLITPAAANVFPA
jgi:hypothetical protein